DNAALRGKAGDTRDERRIVLRKEMGRCAARLRSSCSLLPQAWRAARVATLPGARSVWTCRPAAAGARAPRRTVEPVAMTVGVSPDADLITGPGQPGKPTPRAGL